MMNRWLLLLLFLASVLLGAACKEQPVADAVTPTAPMETAVSTATPPATATVRPTNTPTPQPTPIVPSIAAGAQTITDRGLITIASVLSPQPGWLAIYAEQDGEMGELLGYTAVNTGLNTDLTITVDPLKATPEMVAMLHTDAGEADEFDYPNGPDEPMLFESGRIAAPFTASFQLSLPVITVADQEILEDGWLTVQSVQALRSGWLVIHADAQNELGAYLGAVPIQPGLNSDLRVHIPWQQGTDVLYAQIYDDYGRSQRLEIPDTDTPFIANGQPIIAAFDVTYPPDLYVLDQPVVDGRFIVERAYSRGPGWLVVYFDNDGEPGLIIGSAPLQPGVNEQIIVTVRDGAVTNPLYLRLHEDTEPGDDFDFPRVDPPVVYQERQLLPVAMNTQPGDYIITTDQTIAEPISETATITVPLTVVSTPAWLVILNDNNGVRGDIVGWIPLTPGLNRNLTIAIDAANLTNTLYAGIYNDLGEPGVFEPEDADTAVQRNRSFLESAFQVILTPEE